MNRTALIVFCLLFLGFFSVMSGLLIYFDADHSTWGALNVVAAFDKVLGAWTFVPPALSWSIVGFLVGGLLHYAVWETRNTGQRHRRWLYYIFAAAALALGPLAWPRLEPGLGAPMLWPIRSTSPKAGETRSFANIEFVWIPPGRFVMGSPALEPGHQGNERAHVVVLRNGFWLSKYEVSRGQWKAVIGADTSYFNKGDDTAPVDSVTIEDCHAFVNKLRTARQGVFRLPTEAEWEYACRASSRTAYPFGATPDGLPDAAWFRGNSERKPHPVGLKQPNAWGLFDMLGNVAEWCEDRYDFYPAYRVTAPTGPESGKDRVLRGGSWDSDLPGCRSSSRAISLSGYAQNDYRYGFRIVREAD